MTTLLTDLKKFVKSNRGIPFVSELEALLKVNPIDWRKIEEILEEINKNGTNCSSLLEKVRRIQDKTNKLGNGFESGLLELEEFKKEKGELLL